MFDHLSCAKYFSHIDLKLSYCQIYKIDGNVEKMANKNRYRSYKFLVVSFGLCNALLMFTTLMNMMFCEEMGKFVGFYIDDILVLSESVEEDAKHLKGCFKNKRITNCM